MRVLVCPTALKGTLSAAEAAEAMGRGVRRARPEARVRTLPLSDGGPGLLEAVAAALGGRTVQWTVRGPLSDPVRARVLLREGEAGLEAIVESAEACGLHLMKGRHAPLEAHTMGVGDLVVRALEVGARRVRIGLGGSASTDGGTGLARVFGYRFLDEAGKPLPPGGGALTRLARIEGGDPPTGAFTALADVRHPLTGLRGAARTFGPQKGATAAEVERLVDGLERLERRLREDVGADVGARPGSGAAGGLGAGCAAFLGAEILEGSRWVLETVGFRAALADADLLVTGEGRWDATSGTGKIVGEVLAAARDASVPAVLACGVVEDDPPSATWVDGGGEELGPDGLADRVAEAVRRLVAG